MLIKQTRGKNHQKLQRDSAVPRRLHHALFHMMQILRHCSSYSTTVQQQHSLTLQLLVNYDYDYDNYYYYCYCYCYRYRYRYRYRYCYHYYYHHACQWLHRSNANTRAAFPIAKQTTSKHWQCMYGMKTAGRLLFEITASKQRTNKQ